MSNQQVQVVVVDPPPPYVQVQQPQYVVIQRDGTCPRCHVSR